MEEKLDIISIGESLIELSSESKLSCSECLYKYYGGDALATAIAALRAGSRVGFITRVGNDVFKDFLMDSWQAEGLDISQVKIANEQNGIYFIARPRNEDKELAYYRRKTAPSRLSIEDISEDYILSAKAVYSTGNAMALSLSAAEAVLKAFKIAKEKNITTAFDPNYSSQLSTPDDARENFNNIIPYVDILFMNDKYDTTNILEIDSAENIIKKLWDLGCSTVIIKSSQKGGYYTGYSGNVYFTEFFTKEIVDTTCTGDAFNGGYLHAITHGYTPIEATKFAAVIAGLQATGIGAIKSIPYKNDIEEALKEVV